MLKRYVKIRDAVGKLNDDHVDSLMPSAAQNRQVKRLVDIMIEIDEIQLELQHEACTMLTARDSFDVVTGRHQEMEPRLKSDVQIVSSFSTAFQLR